MTWLLAVVSLIGVVLNVRKDRRGFICWIFTNVAWCAYDFSIGAYAQSVLFAVYAVLAVYGLKAWKKTSPVLEKMEALSER
ncbi:MAG: nicotinamide mononucleotide transporter [Armatimonadota bacterium]|nr:nicotinamide mononucleotide transporter [Armatimonadota bacterium]